MNEATCFSHSDDWRKASCQTPAARYKRKGKPMNAATLNDQARAEAALSCLPADQRDVWVRIGMALKDGLGEDGFALFDRWSQTADAYDAKAVRAVWKSIRSGGIRFGTLFYEAKQRGFDARAAQRVTFKPVREKPAPPLARQARLAQAEQAKIEAEHRTAAQLAAVLWRKAAPAPDTHPYLVRKGIPAYGLRCYHGRLVIGGMACAGALIVPAYGANGVLTTLQFINGAGAKRFLSGGKKAGSFYLIGQPVHRFCLAEGYATAASIHQATGHPVAVAFLRCGQPKRSRHYASLKIPSCATSDLRRRR